MTFGYQVLGFGAFPRGATGYAINNAVWFDGSADYLSRSFTSAPDSSTTQTFSFWVKYLDMGVANNATLISAGTGANDRIQFFFGSGTDDIGAYQVTSSVVDYHLVTTQRMRDPTAWFNVVLVVDLDNGTAGDRTRIYVNGQEVSDFATETNAGASETSYLIANSDVTAIGREDNYGGGGNYFQGYLAEVICLDGTASTDCSEFGELDSLGNWVPVDPSGLTFGTNGFWLDFAVAPGTGNGAGTDVSGNDNHFTDNSMTTAQQVKDSPTDSADDDIGNYCTWNPVVQTDSAGGYSGRPAYSEGNTKLTFTGAAGTTYGSIAVSSGDWWSEHVLTRVDTLNVGVFRPDAAGGYTITGVWANWHSGGTIRIRRDGVNQEIGLTFSDGDRLGIHFDADGNSIQFYKNGSTLGSAVALNVAPSAGNEYAWGCVIVASGDICDSEFGASGFTDTPPAGAVALNTANLPAPTVTDPSAYFKTVLYTGDGTAIGSGGQAITGVGFQPDFVWIKRRSATTIEHGLYDAVRGTTKEWNIDSLNAETTVTESLDSFDADGFTVGSDDTVNTSSDTYVAWCMKAGGSGSSNTDGTITSTASVADHGGFSILTYTGSGVNATVGHGLSSAPSMVIVKNLTDANNAVAYHDGLTSASYAIDPATAGDQADQGGLAWNSTAPTSSVVHLGTQNSQNGSTDSLVMYCFAKTSGLIGIGTYVGNGNADGPYVVCDDGASGFRPAWVWVKRLGETNWGLFDATRSPYNPVDDYFTTDDTGVEATSNADRRFDFLSNGFKAVGTGGVVNTSGSTYLYMAFAEFPFGGSGVAQARAR